MDSTAVLILTFAIIVFGLVSARLRRSVITAPMVFVSLGLLIGGAGLQIGDLQLENTAIHLLAELTLAIVLFSDASGIDFALLRREQALPIRLLAIGLPMCIVFGTVTSWWLFPEYGLWQSAVLASIVAPTDAAQVLRPRFCSHVPLPAKRLGERSDK